MRANIFLEVFFLICAILGIFFQWITLWITFKHLCTSLLSLCSMHSTMKVRMDSNLWLCYSEFMIFFLMSRASTARWNCMKQPTRISWFLRYWICLACFLNIDWFRPAYYWIYRTYFPAFLPTPRSCFTVDSCFTPWSSNLYNLICPFNFYIDE